jgi:hypothetical protein
MRDAAQVPKEEGACARARVCVCVCVGGGGSERLTAWTGSAIAVMTIRGLSHLHDLIIQWSWSRNRDAKNGEPCDPLFDKRG